MKIPYSLLVFLGSCFGVKYEVQSKPSNADFTDHSNGFYAFKMLTVTGDTFDFNQLKGKKVLIVNTASECGYTPQYAELQELYEKHGDKVVVLAFPANDFGRQEPGSNEDIKVFCKEKYKVTFPVFQKITVKGENKHPLYKWLSDKGLNGWNNQEPGWNFCKYLISEKGELLKFYGSSVKPMGDTILKDIL